MSNLVIKNLKLDRELDRSAMASVRGGYVKGAAAAVQGAGSAAIKAYKSVISLGQDCQDDPNCTSGKEPKDTGGNSRKGLGFPWGSE